MTEPFSIKIEEHDAGKRIDRFLAAQFPDYSRSRLQELLRNSDIILNNKACKANTTLKSGDLISGNFPIEKPLPLEAEAFDFEQLYCDDHILVINKPAGTPVHPGPGHRSGTIVNALLGFDEHFHDLMDEYERPGIVHRLDQDTTGVLIIARTAKALSKLSGFFAERQTEKKYLALCIGRLTESPCRLETLIGRHPVDRKRMAVVTKNGKAAISTFIERAAHDDVSLIEAEIESGRTHQIRVHLKHLQCPILGDTVYGSKKDDSGAERQMLHAWQLKIPHPETGDILHFTAPCPPDFSQTAAALKLTLP